MRDVVHQNQLRPVLEVIETQTTRDRVTDDAVFMVKPPGRGWRILDSHRERHSTWIRRRPVVRVWKRQRK
jgi:hypothetical protein